MEKATGEQDLALQQHFPYKSSKLSENSNCCINLREAARIFRESKISDEKSNVFF